MEASEPAGVPKLARFAEMISSPCLYETLEHCYK